MNALLDETRSERLDLGLSFMRQLRVSPTVAALLAEEKPAAMSWGDFATLGMIHLIMSWRSSRGDVRGVIRQGVSLVGGAPDGTTGALTAVGLADGRQPPSKPPMAARKASAS